MAVYRAAQLTPQHTFEVPVQSAALVVGGGAAGMGAALNLAEQGYPVHLVEKEAALGGNLRSIFTASPGLEPGEPQRDPQASLSTLVEAVQANPRISVHLESQVVATSGFMGNFNSTIETRDGELLQ
jgi:heterodisulfide reductase subunit A